MHIVQSPDVSGKRKKSGRTIADKKLKPGLRACKRASCCQRYLKPHKTVKSSERYSRASRTIKRKSPPQARPWAR